VSTHFLRNTWTPMECISRLDNALRCKVLDLALRYCTLGATNVLERFFHAIQSVTLQAIKVGHENGLEIRLMK